MSLVLLVTELECVPKPTMQSLNVREVSALGMSVAERVSAVVCVCVKTEQSQNTQKQAAAKQLITLAWETLASQA